MTMILLPLPQIDRPAASMPRTFEELSPQNFSFNSPLGWCPACEGLGVERGTNQAVLIASPQSSLLDGAVAAWPLPRDNAAFRAFLEAFAAEFSIPLETPWYQLDPRHQRLVFYGSERWISVTWPGTTLPAKLQYKGLYPAIEEAARVSYSYRLQLQDLIGEKPCSVCGGDRLREDAAAVRLGEFSLPQLSRLPLNEVLDFLEQLKLSNDEQKIAGDLLNEATHRLRFLIDVGLHYLSLDRGMPTLSGGESQRIRLAGQIGRALTGVLYVLDEPTIGLHPRDNGRLIEALHKLRDLGNTVVLVEHDREVLEAADQLYDFGPGSGRFGGNITASGTPKQVARMTSASLTGAYLSGKAGIPVPVNRRMRPKLTPKAKSVDPLSSPESRYETPPGGAWLSMTGCRLNNLRSVALHVPLGALTCVTGLSGSGKSSLIQETLARAVARHLNRSGEMPGPFDTLTGIDEVSRVIIVDQNPIGMTPASNPATYTGVFDLIRTLFTKLPDAKIRGYKPGRFSFNRAGGRCEDCEGMGQKKIEMHFLPDVWVTCDTCHGRRYNLETLAVKYKGNSISDVLEMSIGQALELFGNIPKIRAPLATLAAIGLDYLTLGQSATTLSGGEAQRVKLAAELAKPNSGRTLYLLDEPTTGLHFDDIAKLLKVLNSLVEQGNTVVVIEHNLDVIKTADWIVDVGPEAGVGGGYIVAMGTPEEVVEQAAAWQLAHGTTPSKSRRKKTTRKSGQTTSATPEHRSWTGELLQPVLEQHDRGELEIFDAEAAARKQQGDIDIAKVGRDVAAPWQTDGRRWHTHDRIARNGKSCRWEGEALGYVADLLAEYEGLKEANWNDQSTVEVTAVKKTGTGWFFHALSGDEWLLRLYFRVPKGTFDEADVQQRLGLTPVDELDELQVYGRGERVKTNTSKGAFQEIAIDVHWLREIDTPEFREFVKQAAEAYLGKVEQAGTSIDDLMPWKKLGRKWHVSRKGFPSSRKIAWTVTVLEKLVEVLESEFSEDTVDWSNKQVVYWTAPGESAPRVELHTKRRDYVDLQLLTEPGRFALGRIAELANEREVTTHRSGREALKFRFKTQKSVTDKAFREFLKEFVGN
ncbi:MAG: excinuclease ABC subunit UvrA [Planctomycetaceae bacterium]|nr:excinuclease ABC subunit UvrA [Planctomycetaceae bacterium]